MSADDYLQQILNREAVDTGIFSPVRNVQVAIQPIIASWAGNRLVGVGPSGSFSKGTANKSGTDIDLFISLSEETTETLREIYDKLFNTMSQKGYSPRRQDVSIHVRVNGYEVDLVPAKRQNAFSSDYSLYRRRGDTWTKTNVGTHITHVASSGRASEIRIIKLWRDQKGLDFPSFYLQLTVIAALSGQYWGTLSSRVWAVFEYLRDVFPTTRVVDPANTNNVVSNDLSVAERGKIKSAADQALRASNWNEIVL